MLRAVTPSSRAKTYLVYARRNSAGTGWVTGICSRTRLLADAGDDLQFLQTLSAPGNSLARVDGTISQWERNLATGEARVYGPVADVLVTVRSPGNAFDALTDARGRYEIAVPPGKDQVTALPPAGFSARHLQQTIELRDRRACFAADFSVQFDGRIEEELSGNPRGSPLREFQLRSWRRTPPARPETFKRSVRQAARAGASNSRRYRRDDMSSGLISFEG